MTPEQWMNQYVGKLVDGGQCVGWVSTYSKQYLGIGTDIGNHNAKDIYQYAPDANFIKILNNPQDYNQHPEEGDIIIWHEWSSNPCGHIAVCSWTTNGSNFISYDQNWPSGSVVHRQFHDYGNVKGWLRPKNRFWLVNPSIEQARIAEENRIKTEQARIAAEAEAARVAEAARIEAERIAAEKAEADRLEAERLAKEEADKKIEEEKQAVMDKERADAEKAQQEASTQATEPIKEGVIMKGYRTYAALVLAFVASVLPVVGIDKAISEPLVALCLAAAAYFRSKA